MNFEPIDSTNLADCVDVFLSAFNAPPWNENWDKDAATRRLQECHDTPGFSGLLARIGGQPVAFALGTIEAWDKTNHFYLKEMCVASEQQRSGIGAALVEALEHSLKSAGVHKIYLYTARDSNAQNFYQKQGFYVSSKMIMMTKRLKQE